MDFKSVEDAFKEAVTQGVFPGAVLLVGRGDEIVYEHAFGSRSLVPTSSPMHTSTIFDLASLTKPLATTVAIMLLVSEKKLSLDDRVTLFFPTFGIFDKHAVTFRHLLNHSSGLSDWKPYYEDVLKSEKAGKLNFIASRAAKQYVFAQIHREKLVSPTGVRSLYSDLGFIILGEVVEAIGGGTLDRFCQDRIFTPLGLRSMFFIDLTQLDTQRFQPVEEMIAPTEDCPWRKRVLCGEVHDDNAYAMGGVAGHAGLFSSARDIHQLLACLDGCRRGENTFLPQALIQEFVSRDKSVKNSTYALGWDTPSENGSSSGKYFSAHSVGHLGFTGTSIWWDLEKNSHVVLLSNRVHPTRKNEKIREFRPYIHDLIMKTLNP
ncbi:MAG TPA: serine hydrolase domain-containing protein [Candidatus Binatia bacterium]|nr:serine hydrolase domain-containing protein [Candidatus Binatia bacterium]